MKATAGFHRLAIAAALALIPCGNAQAAGERVLMIGDSWGGAGFVWNEVFADNGHPEITLVNGAIPGTKASDWAAQPSLLTNLLAANPDVDWVIVSLGGNDMLQAWGNDRPDGWDERVLDDYRDIVNTGLAVRPDLRFVLVGYDFVNFEQSAYCIALALDTFDGLLTPQINAEFLRVSVAQSTIDGDFSNVRAVAVWGALQAAGGISPAPNVLVPSPAQFFADCIHPNEQGYRIVNHAIYDAYFDQQLDPTCTSDGDADGYVAESCGGVDCNDANPAVHPGMNELIGNGVDDDCNATTPDAPVGGCGATVAGSASPVVGLGLLALTALRRRGARARGR